MQLISLPVSPFAARVRIAIYAKGLPIELVPPPAGWPQNPQFRDVSPTGRIPVLLDERGAIWESAVLLEFLEERFPETPPLLPPEVYDRARARLLMRHVDLYLMPAMVALAQPRTDVAGPRRALDELVNGITMLDGLLGGPQYAVGGRLSLADCALAPALFAARVTGRRLGMDLIEVAPAVADYAQFAPQDPHVARVLREMEDGLRLLVRSG